MKGMRALNRHIDTRIMKATSKLRTVRVRINGSTLTGSALTAFTFLSCDDDPDYDLTTDGTNIAEVPPHTAIVDVKLKMMMGNLTNNAMMEWILFKDPDANMGAALTPDTIFTSDITNTTLQLRKYTLKYDYFITSTGQDRPLANVRIRNKALRRIGDMEDGDKLRFHFNNAAASAGKLYVAGTITVREK